jgi:hypothetical protein
LIARSTPARCRTGTSAPAVGNPGFNGPCSCWGPRHGPMRAEAWDGRPRWPAPRARWSRPSGLHGHGRLFQRGCGSGDAMHARQHDRPRAVLDSTLDHPSRGPELDRLAATERAQLFGSPRLDCPLDARSVLHEQQKSRWVGQVPLAHRRPALQLPIRHPVGAACTTEAPTGGTCTDGPSLSFPYDTRSVLLAQPRP